MSATALPAHLAQLLEIQTRPGVGGLDLQHPQQLPLAVAKAIQGQIGARQAKVSVCHSGIDLDGALEQTGRRSEAGEHYRRALDLARAAGRGDLVAVIEERLSRR